MNIFKLFFVSCLVIFGMVFHCEARHGGRPSDDSSMLVLDKIKLHGPYVVEVDYTVPLRSLIEKVPYNTKSSIEEEFDLFQKFQNFGGKKVVKLYLAEITLKTLNRYDPAVRSGEVSYILPEQITPEQVSKITGKDIVPAGPYELFSFAAQNTEEMKKLKGGSIKTISSKTHPCDKGVSYDFFRIDFSEKKIYVSAFWSTFQEPMHYNRFTVFIQK